MTQEIQLRNPDHLPDLADPLAGYERPDAQAENIFLKLHRLLRNRYHWAILLALVGMGLGGFAAFRITEPFYTCNGLVHVRPVLSPVIRKTFENEQIPMFEQYLQSQVALIKDPRVLEMALQSDEWKRLNRPYSEDLYRDFVKKLNVTVPMRSEIIVVSFEDPQPAAAMAAVRSVLRAYDSIYVESETRTEKAKRQTLENRRRDLAAQIKQSQDAITQVAGEFVTEENLRSMLQLQMQNLGQLQNTLHEIEFELAKVDPAQLVAPSTQPASDQSAATQPAANQDKPLSITEIALNDLVMRQLLADRQKLTADLEAQLKVRGERHPDVQKLRVYLDSNAKAIDAQAEQYRAAVALRPAISSANPALASVSPAELLRRRAKYDELFKAAQARASDLGRRLADIDKLRKQEQQANDDLTQIQKRLQELDVEAPMGRIELANVDDLRATLYKDNRITRGLAGAVAGGGAGFGLILLLSLLDRRYRSPDDARTSTGRLTLLGVLPSLPEDLADPEQAAISAHCVHQIRTLLQISSAGNESRVFTVTSPAAGTGKTSLTLALGVSFAAANSKTLMIDCDIIGGGLTARVEAIIRRKLGQVFKREGLITQQQLDVAMKLAQNSHKRLGEILVDLGYLTEADVHRALTVQEQTPIGMLDALAGENLEDCVAETGILGLDILPVGAAMPNDVGRLSLASLRKLIARARQQYETILIDTGPVPGSLEASVAAAAADGVVMVVSRGDHRPLAERSLQHLRDIGATIAGMVFNRCETRDMDLATTTARLSSFDRGFRPADVRVVDGAEATKFGPVARAVAGRGSAGPNASKPQS